VEKIKEAILNDIELYFYLYRDKNCWYFAIQPSYLDRARTDRVSFEQILEEYCDSNHFEITDRGIAEFGTMWFDIQRDQFRLKPKNGVYDTPLTTKRQ